MSDELENQSPETTTETTSSDTDSTQVSESAPTGAEQVVDLDSIQKFKFAGREWTPKDFQGAYMMQSDYTRKTQAIAEERKYYDNLSYDLESVKSNPSLADKFKSVYPEKYHKYLDYVLGQSGSAQPQAGKGLASLDPDTAREVKEAVQYYKQQRVQSTEAELDLKFKKFSEKYPMADEESVVARAIALINRGEKIDDKLWDGLWKSNHEHFQKKAEQHYSQKVQQQKSKNLKGKDVASGGGVPGQAPKLPRTIKEATNMALQELENS